MKKVLKIFGKLDPGGAELRTLELINELNNRKITSFEFHILALSGQRGLLDEQFEKNGVKIHYIKLKNKKFITKFIKMINHEKINVIYSNVFLFSGIFMFLGWLLRIPRRITHIRTLYDDKKGRGRSLRNSVLRFLIKAFSTDLVGVNKAVIVENFGEKELLKSKTTILYNGIIFEGSSVNKEEKNKERNYINIVHVGRQVKAKNHLKLIEVFIEINKQYKNSNLFLLGKQNQDITLKIESLLKEEGISHKVFFLGVQNNINEHLKNKELMIFPSTREGLPGVVLESLKNGVPVLASDIAPHIELKKYFSGIQTLNTSDSNVKWAETALEIIWKRTDYDKVKDVNEFLDSPFLLEKHVDSYLELYGN